MAKSDVQNGETLRGILKYDVAKERQVSCIDDTQNERIGRDRTNREGRQFFLSLYLYLFFLSGFRYRERRIIGRTKQKCSQTEKFPPQNERETERCGGQTRGNSTFRHSPQFTGR